MTNIKLACIPEPPNDSRAVIKGKSPFFTGAGNINLICPSCDAVLAYGIVNGQIRNLVLKCPKCHTYCEQIPLPSFNVRTNLIVGFSNGIINVSTPVACRRDAAFVGV